MRQQAKDIIPGHYRAGYNPEFYARVMKKRGLAPTPEKRLEELQWKHRKASIRDELSKALRELEAMRELVGSHSTPAIIDGRKFRRIELRAIALFGVSKAALASERKPADIVFARQFVMYWAVRLTDLSFPQIGRKLGNRDHTTVLHGARAYVEKRAKQGRVLRRAR